MSLLIRCTGACPCMAGVIKAIHAQVGSSLTADEFIVEVSKGADSCATPVSTPVAGLRFGVQGVLFTRSMLYNTETVRPRSLPSLRRLRNLQCLVPGITIGTLTLHGCTTAVTPKPCNPTTPKRGRTRALAPAGTWGGSTLISA